MLQQPDFGKTVIILGAPGVGKTEGSRALHGRLANQGENVTLFKEPIPDQFEAFLQYCEGMKVGGQNKHALKFQKWMAASAFNDSQEMKAQREQGNDDVFIWELGPFGHFMYAFKLFREGRMSESQFGEYCAYFFEELSQSVIPQAIIVCMVNDAHELLRRIEQRGRPEEKHYTYEYLQPMLAYWRYMLDHDIVLPIKELLPEGAPAFITMNGQNYDLLSLAEIMKYLPEQQKQVLAQSLLGLLSKIKLFELDAEQINWSMSPKSEPEQAAIRAAANGSGDTLPEHLFYDWNDPSAQPQVDQVLAELGLFEAV